MSTLKMSSFCISICIHSLLKVGRIILSITALEGVNFHFRPMRPEDQEEIDQSQACKMQNRPALGQRCTTGELKYIYLQLENIEQCSVLTMIATICHPGSRIIVQRLAAWALDTFICLCVYGLKWCG